MRFPERPRVIYKHNPLTDVICQIRFARILAIESELPVKFQSLVQNDFPILETRNVISIAVAADGDTVLTDSPKQSVAYDFFTQDRKYKLTLSSGFISLVTKEYTRWEDYKKYLTIGYNSTLKTYRPAIFSRIGLRYVDLIRKNIVPNANWNDLINPCLLGILNSVSEAEVSSQVYTSTISIEDGSVTIRSALVRPPGDAVPAYIIDCDLFDESPHQADRSDILDRIDRLNREAGRVFGWCITKTLHDALEPVPVRPRRSRKA